LFFVIIPFFYVILAYFGANLISKVGVNHGLMMSIPFSIAYYLGLRHIDTFGWLYFLLPLVSAIGAIFKNFSYHLNYLVRSNKEIRGEELSLFNIIVTIVAALGPVIGAFLVDYFSFSLLFLLGSLVLLASYLPLYFYKEQKLELNFSFKEMWGKFRDKRDWSNFVSFSGYAVEKTINTIVWPIFLLIVLGGISQTGLIITITTLASILVYTAIGEATDKYDKNKLIKYGTIFYALGWIGRIFARSFGWIFAVDTYKNLAYKVLQIPWSTKTYDLAESDHEDTFLFIVTREITYKASRVIFLPILLFLFYIDFYPFIASFIFAAIFSSFYVFLNNY
jgi:MFS family permease